MRLLINFNVMQHKLFIFQKVAIGTRHIDVCDYFASLLIDVCNDVKAEPCLETLKGETVNRRTAADDAAPLDIKANCFFKKGFV